MNKMSVTSPLHGKSARFEQLPLPPKGKGALYTIRPGDTFKTIAKEQLGAAKRWKKIAKKNPQIDASNGLPAGAQIRLPVLKNKEILTPEQLQKKTALADNTDVLSNYAQENDGSTALKPKNALLNFLSAVPQTKGMSTEAMLQALEKGQYAKIIDHIAAMSPEERQRQIPPRLEKAVFSKPPLLKLANELGIEKPLIFEDLMFLLQLKYTKDKEEQILGKMNSMVNKKDAKEPAATKTKD